MFYRFLIIAKSMQTMNSETFDLNRNMLRNPVFLFGILTETGTWFQSK